MNFCFNNLYLIKLNMASKRSVEQMDITETVELSGDDMVISLILLYVYNYRILGFKMFFLD